MNAPQTNDATEKIVSRNARTPRVMSVGNCGHDHGQISGMLTRNFQAQTLSVDTAAEALERLRRESFDLVLVNRKLDHDYSDGIEIVKRIKQDPQLASTPVMLITNYAEHQAAAVAEGALPGFGKQELGSPVTRERLTAVLAKDAPQAAGSRLDSQAGSQQSRLEPSQGSDSAS